LRADSHLTAAAILLAGLSSVRLRQCLLLGLVLSSGQSAKLVLVLVLVFFAVAAIRGLPSREPSRRAGSWLSSTDFVMVAVIAAGQDPASELASGAIAYLAIAVLALSLHRLVDGLRTR